MVDRPEDWTTDSLAALRVHLFDGDSSTTVIAPKWTYALFGETEQIFGYKNLRIRIHLHALTLETFLQIDYDAKLAAALGVDAEPVEQLLLDHLPEDTILSVNGEIQPTEGQFELATSLESWKAAAAVKAASHPTETPVHRYNLDSKAFAINKLAMPDQQDRVSRMQIFSILFIEGASLIDVEDDRFDVFVVYEMADGKATRFVGYCTCYKYFFYDKQTGAFDVTRYRISQFLVLPPYQKLGHGGILYDTIFADCQADPKVLEVTVEDPSEAFDDLRDRRDFLRLTGLAPSLNSKKVPDVDPCFRQCSIPAVSTIQAAAREAKVAPAQFRRCLEMSLLRQLTASNKGKQAASKSPARQVRLFIKRRIYKKNAAIMKLLPPGERKSKLAETYAAQVADYQRILDSLKLPPVTSLSADTTGTHEPETLEPLAKRVRIQ